MISIISSLFLINLFYFFSIICVKSFSLGYTKLLVGVGKGLSGRLNSIEIIDLGSSSSSCQDLTHFPRSVHGAIGGLNPNRHPIICGGYSSDDYSFSSACSSYEDGVWNSFPSMTTPRGFAAASPSPYSNDDLFVTGGRIFNGDEGLNTSEVLSDGSWQQISTPLPKTIFRHCMVLLNSTTVLVIGGIQDEYNSPNTYFFNTKSEEWVAGPRLLYGRDSHSCGKIKKDSQSNQESVIVVGGWNVPLMSSVEILDAGASVWRTGPNLPIGITEASMVDDPFGGVVLIGGYNEKHLNTLYQLSHANSDWILMSQKLKIGRFGATTFLVPNEITNCN